MSVLSLHHCGLTVSDLPAALRFWQRALGLELVAEQEREGGFVEKITGEPEVHMLQAHLRAPGTELRVELLQYLAPPGRKLGGMPRDPGHGHVALVVDDLSTLVGRLIAAGGLVRGQPATIPEGVFRGFSAVYVTDVDGHVVELMQPPDEPERSA